MVCFKTPSQVDNLTQSVSCSTHGWSPCLMWSANELQCKKVMCGNKCFKISFVFSFVLSRLNIEWDYRNDTQFNFSEGFKMIVACLVFTLSQGFLSNFDWQPVGTYFWILRLKPIYPYQLNGYNKQNDIFHKITKCFSNWMKCRLSEHLPWNIQGENKWLCTCQVFTMQQEAWI